MKSILVLATLLIPTVATAQVGLPGSQPPAAFSRSTGEFDPGPARFFRVRDTPTMQRQKRDRALALRAKAAMLLEQDGGTLTPEHEAEIRREARDILGY